MSCGLQPTGLALQRHRDSERETLTGQVKGQPCAERGSHKAQRADPRRSWGPMWTADAGTAQEPRMQGPGLDSKGRC